ncbi:MAG TPA: alpha/beta hydrolase [Gemmatimonadaceae bacterium]|nr:alpha/beta hydrolase [Gemmatimonadaceae bacterium]
MKLSTLPSAFIRVLLLVLLTGHGETQSAQLPTRMVTVDGKAMRIWTAGPEKRQPRQPVVILESGAGGGLEHFKPIFSQIAEHVPVFAYDRRGLGQSEVDTVPQTLDRVAQSLHTLLREAQVPPPYVLVGASYGGALIRKFGTLFASETAGFVYLDATDFPTRAELAQLPAGALEATFNLPPIPPDLPPGIRSEIESMAGHFRTEFSELRTLRPPQDVPVAVIIAGAKTWPGISEDARIALLHLQIKHQSEWTQASPKGLLVVPSRARHFLFNDEPALVVDTILYVVRNARTQPAR